MSERDDAVLLRRALARIDATTVLRFVDSLDLRPTDRVAVVIKAPLRNLARGRDVESFVKNAPPSAVAFMVESLTHETLEDVVKRLGDDSSDPSFDQLSTAITEMLADGADVNLVAAMLANSAASHVPAQEHCRKLLNDVEALELPDIEISSSTANLLQQKRVDPLIREQRRRRRDEERSQRQNSKRTTPNQSRVKKPSLALPTPTTVDGIATPVLSLDRRVAPLSPAESQEFSNDHDLCGFVVAVEIPFSASNVEELAVSGKTRPALVIGASDTTLLVRPVFSKDAFGRFALGSWNRLGLDHVSYVGLERIAVPIDLSLPLRKYGRVGDQEWNALL